MKNLKKHYLSTFISVFLACVLALVPFSSSFASPVLGVGLLNDFLSHGYGLPDLFWDNGNYTLRNLNPVVYPSGTKKDEYGNPIKYYTDGQTSGGSHGGGGHERTVLNDEPVSVPKPIVDRTTIYNPVTNSYENFLNEYLFDFSQTNNYVSNTYNSYVFETENYFISYQFDITNFDIVVAPTSNPSRVEYFEMYYELPDGRNSFNLTPEDINGVIFNYDVINYKKTPVTDLPLLGIWHLDGNYYNSVTNDSGYGGNHFVNGLFNGAYQFSAEEPDSFRLDIDGITSSGFTLFFKMFVPYVSTSMSYTMGSNGVLIQSGNSILDGYDAVISSGAWHDVYISYNKNNVNNSSANWFMFDDRYGFSCNSNDIYYGSYPNLGSVVIHDQQNVPHGSFQTLPFISVTDDYIEFNSSFIASDSSAPYTNYLNGGNVIIDEVILYDTVDFDFTDYIIRHEPFDLTYAYTVPDVPFGFVRGSLDVSFTTTSEPISDISDIYFHGDLTSFVPSGANYEVYHLFDCHFADGTSYPINISKTGFDSVYNRAFGKLKVKFRCFKNPYTLTTFVNPYFYDSEGNYLDFQVGNIGVFKGEVGCTVTPVQSLYFSKTPLNSFIAIQSPVSVANAQIGGIRPFTPSEGDVYISLFNNVASSVQCFYNGIWNNVEGSVFYNNSYVNILNFDFANMMLVSDSSKPDNATVINNYNIYNYSSNNGVTVSGNEPVNVVVDTTGTDVNKLSDFIKGIPKIFGLVAALLTLCFPFLPPWLSAVFLGAFTVIFTAFIIVLVKR